MLIESLPSAYRATLSRATLLADELKSLHLKRAAPLILGYSTLAGSAGAIPVPFLDLVLLPAIQARMVQQLAKLYGSEMTGEQFLRAVRALGLGIVARQALREVVKFVPFVGSAASAALASQATYALGTAFCEYFQRAHAGHVPSAETLRALYAEQLGRVSRAPGGSRDAARDQVATVPRRGTVPRADPGARRRRRVLPVRDQVDDLCTCR